MATEAELGIEALHAGDDDLAPLVRALTPEQLTGPSAASEWTVAAVLSHLGSGAVITLASLDAGLAGQPNPGGEANRAIWARWDAMQPQEQADEFLTANTKLLDRFDAVDAATRETLRIDMGFLPEPVDLATFAKFRLNEFALHSWDVRVMLDPEAVLDPLATPLLLGQTGFMLGFIAKPGPVMDGRKDDLLVRLTAPDTTFGLSLGESATLGEAPADPDAVLTAPAEAWLRLATGRLAPQYTPDGVDVTGSLTLETLRQIFPGF